MKKETISQSIARVLKSGAWIVRADNDGVSYNGFKWAPLGEWTEAPDWDSTPECGHGLHGQDMDHGGHIDGHRLTFCETRGKHIAIGVDKVKVRRARILMINELPSGLKKVNDSLNLSGTGITSLGSLKSVGVSLDLSGTGITSLPEGLSVGGYLDLSGTGITSLPEKYEVRGNIYGLGKKT